MLKISKCRAQRPRVPAARSARGQPLVSCENLDPEDVIAEMGLLVITVDARCHVLLSDARHVAHICQAVAKGDNIIEENRFAEARSAGKLCYSDP